jgi:hypothetical protein
MQKDKLSISEQVVLRMNDLCLTKADVARSIGMSPGSLRYHLRNKTWDTQIANLKKLCYALGLDIKSLM